MHIMEFRKMVMTTLYTCQQKTDVKNKLLNSVGEDESGMI